MEFYAVLRILNKKLRRYIILNRMSNVLGRYPLSPEIPQGSLDYYIHNIDMYFKYPNGYSVLNNNVTERNLVIQMAGVLDLDTSMLSPRSC